MASSVTPEAYLDELLDRYRANFDISAPYRVGERTYPAYARFFSLGEKYVLKKEAKLWAIRAYEHVFFITAGHSAMINRILIIWETRLPQCAPNRACMGALSS